MQNLQRKPRCVFRGSRAAGAWVLALWAFGPAWSVQPDAQQATIEPAEMWSTLFAATEQGSTRDVDLHLLVKPAQAFQGRLAWSFAVGQAIVQRREVAIQATPDKPARVAIRLQVPYVRDGLVVTGKLTAALVRADQALPTATYAKKLWLYPHRPFYGQRKRLEDLHIIVYDPKETTATLLKKLDVPFEEIRNSSSLADVNRGLVVVGEGASFDDERGLADVLVKAAARGVRVLCLAPVAGVVPLPERDTARGPARLLFNDASIITHLDKKLDARAWQGVPQIIASSLALKAADGAVAAEVRPGSGGWPWLELSYPNQGCFILMGFGIMKHWDAGPSPRFLFAKIVDRLTKPHDTEPMP